MLSITPRPLDTDFGFKNCWYSGHSEMIVLYALGYLAFALALAIAAGKWIKRQAGDAIDTPIMPAE